jgi:transcriptional regulator with XRE-family HTH domain
MTLKERLKRDLKRDRYTLGHLAKEAGITQNYLTQILKGRTPSIKIATAIARAANKLTGLDTYNTITFLHLND